MKKPPLKGSFPLTKADVDAVKENIEIITGRRGEQCDLAGLDVLAISNPPTQAQVEFVRAQLAKLIRRLEGN